MCVLMIQHRPRPNLNGRITTSLWARWKSGPVGIFALMMMRISKITWRWCHYIINISTILIASLEMNQRSWAWKTPVLWMLLSICWKEVNEKMSIIFYYVRDMEAYDNGSEFPFESFTTCCVTRLVLPMAHLAIKFLAHIADEWIGSKTISNSSFNDSEISTKKSEIFAKLAHTCTCLHTEFFCLKVIVVAFTTCIGEYPTFACIYFVVPAIFRRFFAVFSERF